MGGRKYPRFMIAAEASGSGKTWITCGILQALCGRGLRVASFKCGPDYIDPMFHARASGTKARNLDTFFTDAETTRNLFAKGAAGADISVIEGVMGYYDGLGGCSLAASSYDVARVTDTPVVLAVNCRGMSFSVLALVRGFLEYRKDSRIRGVILNQTGERLYMELKKPLEQELGVRAYGYVPPMPEFRLPGRHLGLVTPDGVEGLQENLKKLGQTLERTLAMDELLELGRRAPEYAAGASDMQGILEPLTGLGRGSGQAASAPAAVHGEKDQADVVGTPSLGLRIAADICEKRRKTGQGGTAPVIAVARDEAFCFLYEENLDLLRELGAELRFFSPLRDETLPEADGLLLYGGYPELYAAQLSENRPMRAGVRRALADGLPCMAECGGFMYLQEELEDMDGNRYPMVGALPGRSFYTKKLSRFGYLTLKPAREQMLGMDIGEIRAHEFHYFDSTVCGDAFYAQKPLRPGGWNCIQGSASCVAGFPHLYYYSNPKVAERFLERCALAKKTRRRL